MISKNLEKILWYPPSVQIGFEKEAEIKDFKILTLLGTGSFGKVYESLHIKSNIKYALKEIDKSLIINTNMQTQINNEVKIMYKLYHKNIIKLISHFEDNKNIYLVIEFAEKGQLYKKLRNSFLSKFDQYTACKYLFQWVKSLIYLHSQKIIHRDIKPENLLLDEHNNLKLADFGWSNFLNKEIRNTLCGTLCYLAPEMWEKSHEHDHNVDIWAVGVLAFEMLTGKLPFIFDNFKDENEFEQFLKKNILEVNYEFPSNFNPLAKNWIKKILIKEPKQRMQLLSIIKHKWFLSNNLIFREKEEDEEVPKKMKFKSNLKNFNFNLNKNTKEKFTEDELNYCVNNSILNKQLLTPNYKMEKKQEFSPFKKKKFKDDLNL